MIISKVSQVKTENPTRLTINDLPDLVSNLKSYMFRVETFDHYSDDDELRAKWLSGKDISGDILLSQWSINLKSKANSGVKIKRVHIVPDVLSDYLRFEVFGYYPISSKLGEEIFILPKSRFVKKDECNLSSMGQDFLLVDDKLFFHQYKLPEVLFQYTELINDPVTVEQAKDEFANLIDMAITLDNFLVKNG